MSQEAPELAPFKQVVEELAKKKKRKTSALYGQILRRAKKDDLVGLKKGIGLHKRRQSYFVVREVFEPWVNLIWGDSPKKLFKEIPDGIGPREFLETQEGLFSLSEFVNRFGRGHGPFDFTLANLTPKKVKTKKWLKEHGFEKKHGNWAIKLPNFIVYLEEFGFMDELDFLDGKM